MDRGRAKLTVWRNRSTQILVLMHTISKVALVSCVKRKLSVPAPAHELYTSQLFHSLKAYAQTHADTWYILSAKHHLLRPDRVIEPYDQTLLTMSKAERSTWARHVEQQLLSALPAGASVIILAGTRYREDIVPFLREHGFSVSIPLEGLRFGEQLAYLKRGSQ